jgi:cation diffusion facilitator CzcD-associated flavoprotein CzcO
MTALLDVAVVGSGFSGLAAGLALQTEGWNFRIFDRGDSVGGVWRDTRYPGAACDIPSLLYCLAERPNPEWSARYASRDEIHAYLKAVAAGLEGRISLDTNVSSIAWTGDCWRIETADNAVRARAVLLAVGPQSRPKAPDFPGLDDFIGSWCHSAEWDDCHQLKGKHVVIVGAGASAVQLVPALAGVASRLTVIQRSPAWVLPRGDRLRPSWRRKLGRSIPAIDQLERGAIYLLLELLGRGNLGNRTVAALVQAVALAKLRREAPDPKLRALLRPDYRLGCKRVMVSDDYWPTFSRSDVTVVRGAVDGFDRNGLVLADGRRIEADHVVFATGYHVADADGYLPVAGLPGYRLPDLWLAEGANAYLGTVATGFPNLAFLLGPNSGLSHSSALHVVESQLVFIRQWLRAVAQDGAIMPSTECQVAWKRWLAVRLTNTVWASGCDSWFVDRAGRNTVIFPGLTAQFRKQLQHFRSNDFIAVNEPSAPVAA